MLCLMLVRMVGWMALLVSRSVASKDAELLVLRAVVLQADRGPRLRFSTRLRHKA
jgi:hypothetical protein